MTRGPGGARERGARATARMQWSGCASAGRRSGHHRTPGARAGPLSNLIGPCVRAARGLSSWSRSRARRCPRRQATCPPHRASTREPWTGTTPQARQCSGRQRSGRQRSRGARATRCATGGAARPGDTARAQQQVAMSQAGASQAGASQVAVSQVTVARVHIGGASLGRPSGDATPSGARLAAYCLCARPGVAEEAGP